MPAQLSDTSSSRTPGHPLRAMLGPSTGHISVLGGFGLGGRGAVMVPVQQLH